MKIKVFALFDRNDQYLDVFGTFDQAIAEVKEWIKAEYWNYSDEEIFVQYYLTGFYEIQTRNVPEHRDDNVRLVTSFTIIEQVVETEDI